MATRELVRLMQTTRPFRPFLVKLADGRSFVVRHPELVSCSLNERPGDVPQDEAGVHLIEMLMSIELIAAPDAEAAEKPQAKRRRPGKEA